MLLEGVIRSLTIIAADHAVETLLMQWITFKIYITTVYQFTPGITSSLDILWFTCNPKWLVMCMLVSILVQGASGCAAQHSPRYLPNFDWSILPYLTPQSSYF